VLRVLSDGVDDSIFEDDLDFEHKVTGEGRYPDIVAGLDGGIWILLEGGFYRLGESAWMPADEPDSEGYVSRLYRPWNWGGALNEAEFYGVNDFDVAPDGTVWSVIAADGGQRLYSMSPEEPGDWVAEALEWVRSVDITSDGTVWAAWESDESASIGYLGPDGWQTLGEPPYLGELHVSDAGDVWISRFVVFKGHQADRYVDGTWQSFEGQALGPPYDLGPDGTLWIGGEDFVRLDGTGQQTFQGPDWMPDGVDDWKLVDDEWTAITSEDWAAMSEEEMDAMRDGEVIGHGPWSDLRVAPDGSLWVAVRLGTWGELEQTVCDQGMDGIAHYDGVAWTRYLQGYCVEEMDIATDGSGRAPWSGGK
jgi:hypothetical protein